MENDGDEEGNGNNKCKLKFNEWLCNVVRLKQYLSHFEENECDDAGMIQDLDEKIIEKDIRITKTLHCKFYNVKSKWI